MEDTRRPITDYLPLGHGAERLARMLDSLVTLSLEIASDTQGEKSFVAALGRAKLLEVRTALETAVRDVKRVIEKTDRRSSRGDGQQHPEGVE